MIEQAFGDAGEFSQFAQRQFPLAAALLDIAPDGQAQMAQ
jgi:hypothetical protein